VKNSIFAISPLLLFAISTHAQLKITVDHNTGTAANSSFSFKRVSSPARDDLASTAKLTLVDGDLDGNGAGLAALVDGVLPREEDEPGKNLFFAAGTGGGRIRMDFGRVLEIAQVNSYSWHPNARGPQVYAIWASDASDAKFNAAPKAKTDPRSCGWKLITVVDTRPERMEDDGGQYGVSVSDATGVLGKYRYLLFDLFVVETADEYGNTFYSEIDVLEKK
jgi:hypothetical protein